MPPVSEPPLTLNPLTSTIVAPSSNASKWQMGFDSAFKRLIQLRGMTLITERIAVFWDNAILIDRIPESCSLGEKCREKLKSYSDREI